MRDDDQDEENACPECFDSGEVAERGKFVRCPRCGGNRLVKYDRDMIVRAKAEGLTLFTLDMDGKLAPGRVSSQGFIRTQEAADVMWLTIRALASITGNEVLAAMAEAGKAVQQQQDERKAATKASGGN
jgi:DNA-directed RNA polymerase subunit RPC12/RpoP